jgi:hypothetical protein
MIAVGSVCEPTARWVFYCPKARVGSDFPQRNFRRATEGNARPAAISVCFDDAPYLAPKCRQAIENRGNRMCDYSLHNIASQPAKVGDKLVTTEFATTLTRGFASIDEPTVAVCLRSGTELVFDREPDCFTRWLPWRPTKLASRAAIFRQINADRHDAHHDALEFSDGTILLLTRLCPGQRATVLQLPAEFKTTTVPNKQAQPADFMN